MTEATQTETFGFQTEVKELLNLVAHNLYSNKEVFLRELISNASDAADKLRFKALSDSNLYEDDANLRVRVSIDTECKALTITDNGIGMTRDEVIQNLGTIARSGTKAFFQKLSGDETQDSQLIGQFGVGFYSAFIVADKVTVYTRAAGLAPEDGVCWESDGQGSFTLTQHNKADRGTEIVLHLRESEQEFLNDWRLRSIISKYSDHISIPVEMWKEPTSETEEAEDEDKTDEQKEQAQAEQAENTAQGQWEQVNRATALWTRTPKDIQDEEYKEFYKHIGHDYQEPMLWAHNKVEGNLEYTSLLYIPAKAPWDMWNREHKHGLKLYVQRVFIMDDAQEFMPSYLRFVKGLLDSNNLPLNVSREILQDNKITAQLRKACTKRVLNMLSKLANDDQEKYQLFWKEFGRVLKEGPAEDWTNREEIAKLLRFASTHHDTSQETVSLEAYCERMKDGQEKIYFLTAESFDAAKNSPHLELFRQKGIEVLLMSDRVDEWLMSHLNEFDGKKFVSVTSGDLELGDLEDAQSREKKEALQKEHTDFVTRVKNQLGDVIRDVRVTNRLTQSPSCVVTDGQGMSSQMMKLMQAAGQSVPEQKFILELNPEHTLIQRMMAESDDTLFGKWAWLMFDQARLAEQGSLQDPTTFIHRLNELLAND